MKDLHKLAAEIIKNNQYVVLSTVTSNKLPWISTVVYTFDKKGDFYFISKPDSLHATNIKSEPKISLAIFDSHQLFGLGVGLQIEAIAHEVSLLSSITLIPLYFQRKWPYGSPNGHDVFEKLIKGNIYRFYKIKPVKYWMNDPREETDVRIALDKDKIQM